MSSEERIQQLEQEVATLQEILDHAYECIVVVDTDGFITHLNRTYEEMLGLAPGEAIGRHVTEVIENTRMHIVARTGKAEIGHSQMVMGQERIVQRVPIIRDGRPVGAVGKFMFKDLAELRELSQRIGQLESKVAIYEAELRKIWGARYTFDQIIGTSGVLAEAKRLALRAAQSGAAILLLGESGTGKELFAHAIHQSSLRAAGPFIRVNCAAIPTDLLESELFGYEEGAFSGARKGGKPGKLELAHKGTIFLDEIGEMPLAMQAKLLRALQEKEIDRVGGVRPIQVDLRIIAATNAHLEQRVADGRFREDLFYRLNVITITLPPLRERIEDLPLLVEHGLRRLVEREGAPRRRLSPALMDRLLAYHWPGNVRELLNLLERLVYTAEGEEAGLEDLPPGWARQLGAESGGVPGGWASIPMGSTFGLRASGAEPGASPVLHEAIAGAEREALLAALRQAKGSKSRAARLLGIHRSTLYEKMERYGLR